MSEAGATGAGGEGGHRRAPRPAGGTPRGLAAHVLGEIRRRDAWAPAVLDQALNRAGLDVRDAGFVTRLVYGTAGAEGTLDEALDRFLSRPGSVEPHVRDALRAGAYELLFMQGPPHAVVDSWVEEVKCVTPRAAGLANAVLRKVAQAAPDFPWGDPACDMDALARSSAHPRWVVDLFMRDLGEEAARLALSADDSTAPLYLWVNPFKATVPEAIAALDADGADPTACFHEGCLRAGNAGAAVRGRALAKGLVLVTDAAAQVAALATGAHPGRVVVDAAAGRGTKTAELQALSVAAGAPADVRALDLHEFKTGVLKRRMADLGVPGVTVATADAGHPLDSRGVPPAGSAAAVLLDAPCTGLGTLRRRPEKRWRLQPGDVHELAVLQLRLLRGVAPLVAPGGRLVYATCSVSRDENERVVDAFLAGQGGQAFESLPLASELPEPWRVYVGPDGRFRTAPAPEGPDGHFVAALRRMG